jgi:hypothetical protein
MGELQVNYDWKTSWVGNGDVHNNQYLLTCNFYHCIKFCDIGKVFQI